MGPLGFLLLVPLPPALDDPERKVIYRISCPVEPGAKEVTKERLQKVLNVSLGLPESQIPQVETILWSSRFRIRSAVADQFYQFLGGGVVTIVGDAAHVHSPAGGQGMNLGIRDAISLGGVLSDIMKNDKLNGPSASAKKEYAMQRLAAFSKERRDMAMAVIKMTKVMTWLTNLESPYARKMRNTVWWFMGKGSGVSNKVALRLSGLQLESA